MFACMAFEVAVQLIQNFRKMKCQISFKPWNLRIFQFFTSGQPWSRLNSRTKRAQDNLLSS